jgi:hypothetical protein
MNPAGGEKENVSVLNAFDFAAIEEMDPSIGIYTYHFISIVMHSISRRTQSIL